MDAWSNFFLGQIGAASAFAGLLFVSVSVNQARILALGRMADRGLEALAMLFLVLVVASLPLIPGQPVRLLGAEILLLGGATFAIIIRLHLLYLRQLEPQSEPIFRPRTAILVAVNRLAVGLIALSGAVLLWRADTAGFYLLAPGMLLCFAGAGANAWVLLIEINR